MWRVGVDSGGTFTDICVVDESSGDVRVWKVPSTPDDPSRAIVFGVVDGLRATTRDSTHAVSYFGHGTTVATNALIQHRGATTGLVTTDGFRDLLEIARQRRPHLYDLQTDKPPVLVPRALRIEVPERVRHDGRIETPLDEAAVRAAVRTLKAAGAQSVAVCFLYCYVEPRHEQRVRRIVEEEFSEAFSTDRTISRRGLLGGAGAALLTAPGLRHAARARAGWRVTFALSSYPPSIRPWQNTGTAAATVKLMLHRGLVSYDAKGELRGELAESWRRETDRAGVFTLRSGAQFQDG